MDTLGEDLVLLSLSPDSGRVRTAQKIGYGLMGSELVRLAASGRVDVQARRIIVLGGAPFQHIAKGQWVATAVSRSAAPDATQAAVTAATQAAMNAATQAAVQAATQAAVDASVAAAHSAGAGAHGVHGGH